MNEEQNQSANYVLDASAVLALINREPGGEQVRIAIHSGAIVSAVNLAEVVTRLMTLGMTEDTARSLLSSIRLVPVGFSDEDAYQVGFISNETRKAGLSLADRACLVLAASKGIPALTSDRAWQNIDVGVEIRLIR